MHHVEVDDEEAAGRHRFEHHAVGRDRMGVEMAAALHAGGAHRHRRLVGKVEADEEPRRVMAGPGQRALRILMPAGTGHRTLAHARGVGIRGRGFGVLRFQRRAAVYGPVRMQVIVRPRQRSDGAMHDGTLQHFVHLRHSRQNVVAVAAFVFVRVAQLGFDLGVQGRGDVRREAQEAVGDEGPHLGVVKKPRRAHCAIASVCSNVASKPASSRALVAA